MTYHVAILCLAASWMKIAEVVLTVE